MLSKQAWFSGLRHSIQPGSACAPRTKPSSWAPGCNWNVMINLLTSPVPLPADRDLERVDQGLDAGPGRHGEVFHLKADPDVVAYHSNDGEELIPPLQVVASATADTDPTQRDR